MKISASGTTGTHVGSPASGEAGRMLQSSCIRRWRRIGVAALAVVVLIGAPTANAQPGTVDPGFNPDVTTVIYDYFPGVFATSVQADGKIIIGGAFSAVGGLTRSRVARLNSDGTVDTLFDAGLAAGYADGGNSAVRCTAVQTDGKVIVGGHFNPGGSNGLLRFNGDGTRDTGFNAGLFNQWDPELAASIVNLLVQPDGKILISGYFTRVGGLERGGFARLNPDGTVDAAFNPSPGRLLAIQTDGKIITGGSSNHVTRLNADGTPDPSFDPGVVDGTVYVAEIQADGKIVLGGNFGTVAGVPRNYIARLDADGTLDSGFNPAVNGAVTSIDVQADGKLILAGEFTLAGGEARHYSARLYPNGALDFGFDPNPNNGLAYAAAIQADGKVLLGGRFTTIGGVQRNWIARLEE